MNGIVEKQYESFRNRHSKFTRFHELQIGNSSVTEVIIQNLQRFKF